MIAGGTMTSEKVRFAIVGVGNCAGGLMEDTSEDESYGTGVDQA